MVSMKYAIIMLMMFGLLFPSVCTPPPVQVVSLDEQKYQCNRYGDPRSNFEVLSINFKNADDAQGRSLAANVDNIKAWLMTRWALPDENFPVKCKVVLTPSREVFKELFGKEPPQYRIAREPSGQAKELSVWLSADDPRCRTSSLSNTLTEICLQEWEARHGKVGYWVHRGMPIVNGDLPSFRQKLGNLCLIYDKDLKVYWSKEILSMTPEVLAKHPPESAAWFDSESAAFLHMLYKEFGARKFNTFLAQCRTTDPEAVLKSVYGFNSYAECDGAFKQYMFKLSSDIAGRGKMVTPNSYLTWPLAR